MNNQIKKAECRKTEAGEVAGGAELSETEGGSFSDSTACSSAVLAA